MAVKVTRLSDRIQQKWAERAGEQRDVAEALPGVKRQLTCKCPHCCAYHEAAVHWTGRGTPRLFCPGCRSRIAAMGSGPLLRVSSSMVSNIRRRVHQGQE